MNIVIKILIGVVGYGVWAFMAWFDPSLRPDFLKFNVAMAVGTIGLVLRDMQTPVPAVSVPFVTNTITAAAPPAPDKGQGGFASIRLLTIIIGMALGLALLGGCASIDQAGTSAYTVRAVKGADGKTGYELDVKDGKEYAERQVQFQTVGNAASLAISETGVKAFKGQALAVKALTVLPVTNLGDILK